MGLFSKKKSKEELRQAMMMPPVPELPEFPDLPEESDSSEFPSYEPTIADIKNEVEREDNGFDIPRRYSGIKPKVMSADLPKEGEDFPTRQFYDEEKPVFVKIEKYKEAMKHMDLLAKKMADADDILNKLEDIRSKEEQKIEDWKKDLSIIKEKLLAIDKELFGG